MPGPYSSQGSIDDAAALARNLGIRFEVIPIGDIFDSYLQSLQPVFADRPADVTEENVQARIRGALLMALSNKFGALVLTTGNKSEIGVGYCTLYGDMCGGLAVISDVPKTLVYRLARYVNSRAPVIPESTIEKPPSAELRPDQKDSDSLPPYDVLDTILEAYVEDNQSPDAIAAEHGYRSGTGSPGRSHGRSQRVQAPAGCAGTEDLRQGIRLWPSLPDSREARSLIRSKSLGHI